MTYSDPEVFTAPWTARLDWTRDDSYQFYEYACNEGNAGDRNYILATRSDRPRRAQAPGNSADVRPGTVLRRRPRRDRL